MCVIKTNGLAFHRKGESSIGESLEGENIGRGKRPPRLGILRFRLGEKPLTRAPKARNFASTTKNNWLFHSNKMKPYEKVDSYLSSDSWFTLNAVLLLRLLALRTRLWVCSSTTTSTSQRTRHYLVIQGLTRFYRTLNRTLEGFPNNKTVVTYNTTVVTHNKSLVFSYQIIR